MVSIWPLPVNLKYGVKNAGPEKHGPIFQINRKACSGFSAKD
jgi:hypothetical protein